MAALPLKFPNSPMMLREQLTPDVEEARRFLELLDSGATEWVFQTFDDSDEKRAWLTRTFYGSLHERWTELEQLNAAGAGVFVTINEIEPGKPRRAEFARRVRALFIDLDEPARFTDVWSNILQYGQLPSIVTQTSPGKFQIYWLVNNCPLELFKAAQQQLAALFGTDRAVCDLPRVLRLPGFVHRKATPFRSKLVDLA
jgi:hypothetical protein